eukprot:evm.model.scf_130EXC.8 EVM.evm.TU.scf_130EXC.8   scf_130EXC:112879-114990(+)
MPGVAAPRVAGGAARQSSRPAVATFCMPRQCRAAHIRASFRLRAAVYGENPTVSLEQYLALGLSHCFEKTEEGKLDDKFVIEPIGASSLECMANGAKTSFKFVTGITLEEALQQNKTVLPKEFNDGLYCQDFEVRCQATARTWARPHAQDNLMDIVPLGQLKGGFNFSLDDKRVLNFENVVSDEDNIKQDMSIDVYGREPKEESKDSKEGGEAAVAEAEQPDDDDEEDELEALLAA